MCGSRPGRLEAVENGRMMRRGNEYYQILSDVESQFNITYSV